MCFFRKRKEKQKEKEERSRNSTLTIDENDDEATVGFMNSGSPVRSQSAVDPKTVQYFSEDDNRKTEAYFEPVTEKEREVVLVNKKDSNLVYRATITGSIQIGNGASSCAIVISGDPTVSRHHCKIEESMGKYYLFDGDGKSNSTNGTFLNGHRIQKKELLYEGDIIKMGRGEYIFSIE